jgi:hypothetical protein
LAFTESELGQSFYGPRDRLAVSFYQLESDPFGEGTTFASFGRYALFRVIGGSPRVRAVVDLTASLRQDEGKTVPPVAIVGSARVPLRAVGHGSARLFSSPLEPQVIDDSPFLLLDMGEAARINPVGRRPGLTGLYGRSVILDTRALTVYVRDISLISDEQYRHLSAPSMLDEFPAALRNQDLEYSGFYEDGSIAEEGYAVLSGPERADLVLEADVEEHAARRLQIFVDGRRVLSRAVEPGSLRLRIALPTSRSPRSIELHWTGARSPIAGRDDRPVCARLIRLGVVSRNGS